MKKHNLSFLGTVSLCFYGFLFSSCSNSLKSLKQAYQIVMDNDANAAYGFSISDDNTKVKFKLDYSERSANLKTQLFIDLNMFMLMIGYDYNDYLVLENAFQTDDGGTIKKIYSCEWLSSSTDGFQALFY